MKQNEPGVLLQFGGYRVKQNEPGVLLQDFQDLENANMHTVEMGDRKGVYSAPLSKLETEHSLEWKLKASFSITYFEKPFIKGTSPVA